MVPRTRMAALDIDTPLQRGRSRIVAASPYSRLPVYRELARQRRRHAAHQGPGALARRAAARQATLAELIRPDRQRARERDRRPRAAPLSRAARRTRRWSSTSSAARPASSRSRTCCRSCSARWATSSRPASRWPSRCPTAASGCRARWPSTMPPRLLDTAWETDATTVGGLVTAALGRPAGAGRHGHHRRLRVRGRARRRPRARVGARAPGSRPTTRRRAMSVRPDPARHHRCCSSWPTGCSWRRSSPSSARRARSIEHQAGEGSRLAAARGAHPRATRGGRTATSPPPRSASRSPAWAWACTASTCWRSWIEARLAPLDALPLVRRAHASPASSRWPSSPTSTSCSARWCRRRWRCRRAQRTVLYVSPIIDGARSWRSLPLVVGAERGRQRAAVADRRRRGRATRASAITPPRSCSSSSRRARKAGCCAANRAASCASCSSSAT